MHASFDNNMNKCNKFKASALQLHSYNLMHVNGPLTAYNDKHIAGIKSDWPQNFGGQTHIIWYKELLSFGREYFCLVVYESILYGTLLTQVPILLVSFICYKFRATSNEHFQHNNLKKASGISEKCRYSCLVQIVQMMVWVYCTLSACVFGKIPNYVSSGVFLLDPFPAILVNKPCWNKKSIDTDNG